MTISSSGIDDTKPAEGSATTQSVRDNFTEIKAQFDNAQTDVALKAPIASPTFTGNARVSRGAHIGNYTSSHTNTGSTTTIFGNYSGGVYSGMMIDNTWDGTYNDDAIRFVTHDGGATSHTPLTLTKDGDATFGGNTSIGDAGVQYLGTDNDMLIKHNGANGYIQNDTGALHLYGFETSGLIRLETFNSADAVKTGIVVGGTTPAVSLYYDGVVALSTIAGAGISVSGDASFGGEMYMIDNKPIYFGTGLDSRVYNDGATLFVENLQNSQVVNISSTNSVGARKDGINVGGATPYVRLYYDGVAKAETTAAGMQFQTGTGNVEITADGAGPWFGTSSAHDLRFVTNGSSRMKITSSGTIHMILPTSASGLSAGDLWNNSGVVTIV